MRFSISHKYRNQKPNKTTYIFNSQPINMSEKSKQNTSKFCTVTNKKKKKKVLLMYIKYCRRCMYLFLISNRKKRTWLRHITHNIRESKVAWIWIWIERDGEIKQNKKIEENDLVFKWNISLREICMSMIVLKRHICAKVTISSQYQVSLIIFDSIINFPFFTSIPFSIFLFFVLPLHRGNTTKFEMGCSL